MKVANVVNVVNGLNRDLKDVVAVELSLDLAAFLGHAQGMELAVVDSSLTDDLSAFAFDKFAVID